MRGAFTEAEDVKLREGIAANMSPAAIGAMIDRSPAGVRRRAELLGIRWSDEYFRQCRSVISRKANSPAILRREQNKARAIELAKQGLTRKQIAEKMGLSKSTIGIALLGISARGNPSDGAPKKTKQAGERKFRIWTPEEDATLREMRERGETHEAIGRALNRTREAVMRRQHNLGVRLPEQFVEARKREAVERLAAGRAAKGNKPIAGGIKLPPMAATFRDEIPLTTAAASFLGRWFRPVYNAAVSDPKNGHGLYVVGNKKVPVSEMLAMARDRGFGA